MSKTVSEYLVEALEKTGVKRVYGVVGDSLNGVSDALRRRKSIDWIHMRHEEAAAFAAGAEAHLTGNLAVCAGSCGPGNLHLINGLFDCQRSGVPVLAIASHIPSSEIGIDYFQATHPESLFKECSHYVELVSSANQLPQILKRAIRVAIAKRGVAVIVLPGDVALTKVDADVPEAPVIFERRSRRYSRNAAITPSWSPAPTRCRARLRSRSVRRSASAAYQWPSPGDVALQPAVTSVVDTKKQGS